MAASHIAKTLLFNFIVDEVCYLPYGCFRRDGVFKDKIIPLPQSPSFINTKFLYHKYENDAPIELNIKDRTMLQLKRNRTTIIIAHGFLEDQNAFWLQDMVNAFLQNIDANIIVVDWKIAARFPYNQAISNIRIVSVQLEELLQNLKHFDISPSNIHLIGFSLGAHLVGMVGRKFRDQHNPIERITGLDPAGPYFEGADTRLRLDPTDAKFVDVIHTDSKLMMFGGLGYRNPLGHVDFYPNKGFSQPGCTGIPESIMSKQKILRGISCSHYRAAEYFTESIEDRLKFHAYMCRSADEFTEGKCHMRTCYRDHCNTMGYHARKYPGKYFLNTNSAPPYAANHFLIKVRTGKHNFADSLAKLTFTLYSKNAASRPMTMSSRYLRRGKERLFLIHAREKLLPLVRIKVGHNAVLWSDGWFLNKITIISLDRRERYFGCLNSWLAENSITIRLRGPTHERNKCQLPQQRVRTKLTWLWG